MGYSFLIADIPHRLEAKFIDALLLICAVAPSGFIWKKGILRHDYTCTEIEEKLLLTSLALIALLFVVQVFFLAKWSQTVGKRCARIKIVRRNGMPASAFRVIFIREFLVWLIGIVPIVGQVFLVADFCFLFRDGRRCLHDYIADTTVKQVLD